MTDINQRCREDAAMLHMLGLDQGQKNRPHRNYFAADVGSEDDQRLRAMKEAGLVRCYRQPSQGLPYRLYCVTDAGKQRITATYGAFEEDR